MQQIFTLLDMTKNQAITLDELEREAQAQPENYSTVKAHARQVYLKDKVKAIPLYEKLIEMKPDNLSKAAQTHLALAVAYELNQEDEKAIAILEKMAEQRLYEFKAAQWMLFGRLGRLYFHAGQYEKAVQTFSQLEPLFEDHLSYEEMVSIGDDWKLLEGHRNRLYLPFAYAKAGQVEEGRQAAEMILEEAVADKSYELVSAFLVFSKRYGHYEDIAKQWHEKISELSARN